MRKALLLTAFAFGIAGMCSAEEPTFDKRIEAIQAEVASIDKNISEFQKTSKQLEGISVGAEATYFTSVNGMKKIIAKIYGKTGRSDNEYYYRDGELIFAHQRWTKYAGPVSAGEPKVLKVQETLAYFESGECFALLVDKKNLKPASTAWNEAIYSVEATSTIFKSRF